MSAIGCTQSIARAPADARAAGGLDARPASTLVPSDLAYGRDVAAGPRAERALTTELDASYSKEQPVAQAKRARVPAASKQKPERKQRAPKPAPALPPPPVMALALGADHGSAATEQPAEQAPVAQNRLPGGDMERYAQRQQRSRDLSGYRGGDGIVITSGALIVALLIVLLVVLLT
jgi:hypothetical protein